MTTVTYNVPAISCGHCVHTIQTELSDLKGVQSVQASAETKTVLVTFDAPATPEMVEELLAEINYPVVK
ncbi:MAG: heavy-metal-associated domain-containing protein [Anaerolineaceae bacterium]|nr:heavy-metal-associated domain-containing protein [Anaerolineaceae bacterium]